MSWQSDIMQSSYNSGDGNDNTEEGIEQSPDRRASIANPLNNNNFLSVGDARNFNSKSTDNMQNNRDDSGFQNSTSKSLLSLGFWGLRSLIFNKKKYHTFLN